MINLYPNTGIFLVNYKKLTWCKTLYFLYFHQLQLSLGIISSNKSVKIFASTILSTVPRMSFVANLLWFVTKKNCPGKFQRLSCCRGMVQCWPRIISTRIFKSRTMQLQVGKKFCDVIEILTECKGQTCRLGLGQYRAGARYPILSAAAAPIPMLIPTPEMTSHIAWGMCTLHMLRIAYVRFKT